MGNNEKDYARYIKMLKTDELYAAETRDAAARRKRKEGMKNMPLGIKIAEWMNYWLLRDKYKISAYRPMSHSNTGIIKTRVLKARTQDRAIIKFHKYYPGELIRNIEKID
jgi:hypothetical protein